YQVAVAILFLDRLGDKQDKQLIQRLALRLVASQKRDGGWLYDSPPLSDEEHQQLYGVLQELQAKDPHQVSGGAAGQAQLLKRVQDLPVLKPNQNVPWAFSDNSNTQFACLALWAARKHDVPLDRTLGFMSKHFRGTQKPDGSWFYLPGGNVRGINE